MKSRYENAHFIIAGACNPSGICHSIIEACNEIRAEGGGTNVICTDPAVRLMVFQLAYITNASSAIEDLNAYRTLIEAVEEKMAENIQEVGTTPSSP